MVDVRLWKQWQVTASFLTAARAYLLQAAPQFECDDSAKLEQFDMYMQPNELGLALEEIAELGKSYHCRGGFWRNLERAAEVMQLHDLAAEYHAVFSAVLWSGVARDSGGYLRDKTTGENQ